MTREIISDTITRDREFQKQQRERVKRLKELRAPQHIIDVEEHVAKMTVAEYEIYCREQDKIRQQEINDYAAQNPIREEIVNEIYRRVEAMEYDQWCMTSRVQFVYKLHPLEFMSNDDYHMDLYQTFIDHAEEIYHNKYKDKHEL